MKKLTFARMKHPTKRRRSARRFFYLARVPRLRVGIDVALLWSYGGYDGSCSGCCDVDGNFCFYAVVNGIEAHPRIFAVVRLSTAEEAQHRAYHARYVELIDRGRDFILSANRISYDRRDPLIDDDERRAGDARLELEFPKFTRTFARPWESPYKHQRIVGWFDFTGAR